MRPPALHSNFFSSLKQVEKRLKLENPSQASTLSSPPPPPPPPQPPGETSYTPVESLSSPIFLNFDQPNSTNNNNSSSLQDSEPPRQFLSNSLDFPPIHEDIPQAEIIHNPQTINRVEFNNVDEIELLIQLLGLSDCEEEKEEEQNKVDLDLKNCGETCGYECGFYSKMIGVKGPKCGREMGRLEAWIKHFLNDGGEGRREPLRLTHLLLGKAAFLSECGDGFGRFEFPSTIAEFLQNDPPKD